MWDAAGIYAEFPKLFSPSRRQIMRPLFFYWKVGSAIYLIAETGTLLLVRGIIHCYELVSADSIEFFYDVCKSSQEILIVIAL